MLKTEAGMLDAVYVSTPHVLHGANALAVVEAGLDLLLEKPMVCTVDEALGLLEAEKPPGAPLSLPTRDAFRRSFTTPLREPGGASSVS